MSALLLLIFGVLALIAVAGAFRDREDNDL